ncbi:MAG: deaminase [Desulfuromonadales bacterium C00003068]|nr:MAG: deaminase [Desulfuromonadales bacterium C00003068]
MSLEISVFISTSLDGYIAREDGGLDWLDAANADVPDGEDFGFIQFMQSIDSIVMGRKTYEKVLSFGGWPYGAASVIVLSRTPIEFPDDSEHNVSSSSESLKELCHRLESEGQKHLYVDGGITIRRFLADGLITDVTVTTVPVVLGSGIPLFGSVEKDITFEHVATKSFDVGFVQSTYNVKSA